MAGYLQVERNAAKYASEVYFHRLEATSLNDKSISFVQAKKIMLSK